MKNIKKFFEKMVEWLESPSERKFKEIIEAAKKTLIYQKNDSLDVRKCLHAKLMKLKAGDEDEWFRLANMVENFHPSFSERLCEVSPFFPKKIDIYV